MSESKHRNDIYGDIGKTVEAVAPAIPAATVILLRDAPDVEVLMLHKTSKIAFGGMWVFPGGRIDPEDHPEDGDENAAARNAAAREAHEEAGVVAEPDDFVWFAHWTPPASTLRRFATWFFAARAGHHDVSIDGGEIQDHAWIGPGAALERHSAGEIDLAPPTWITLYHLSRYGSVDALLERLGAQPTKFYETRLGVRADATRIAMWHGDAGYAESNADVEGARHRLVMAPGGFEFENTVEDY